MTRKSMIAAALTLLMSAPVFADTPIGKGVTGAGGTGPNTADIEARQREAQSPPTQGLNPDGSESSRAGTSQSTDMQDRARGATSVAPGTGSSTGSGATTTDVPKRDSTAR